MNTQGKVFKYPDNVDTDVIIPARYLNTPDAKELALHCMEDIDTEFVKKVQTGDVMVAGWNFGCGSSREHAPLVIKTCGTGCVIAKSFARIFYRNAINIGLPILECEEAAEEINADDEVKVDFDTGIITDIKRPMHYEYGKYCQSTQHPMYMELFPEALRFDYLIFDGAYCYREPYRRGDFVPIHDSIRAFVRYLNDADLMETYKKFWEVN